MKKVQLFQAKFQVPMVPPKGGDRWNQIAFGSSIHCSLWGRKLETLEGGL